MKKIALLVLVLLGVCSLAYGENAKKTRLYTPVIKQATYTAAQTDTTIWTPTAYESIVWDSFIISTNAAFQTVTFTASDTIVVIPLKASDPVVSPGSFLWKKTNETILISTSGVEIGTVNVTLTGWEEDN